MGLEVGGIPASGGQKTSIRTEIGALGSLNDVTTAAIAATEQQKADFRAATGTDGSTTEETVSTTTYSVAAADFTGKTKVFTHASGCLVTAPQGLDVTTGAVMQWRQGVGAGQITFQGDGTSAVASIDNVLVSGGEKSVGYLQWLGSNSYLLVGQLRVSETHMIPVTATGLSPSTIDGCAPLATIAGAAGQPDYSTLNFDATTAEYAQFTIPMPESWDGETLKFKPIWSHAATTVNFGTCWKLQAVAMSNDDTLAANFGAAQSSVGTGGTTDDVYIGPMSSPITVAGTPAAGDIVFFRLYRDPADAGDTMAIDARLHGIRVYFNASAVEDA